MVAQPDPMSYTLVDLDGLQDDISDWQDRTFPGGGTEGRMNHAAEELDEIKAEPGDVEEYADVLILLMGQAKKFGITASELILAARHKHGINREREWGDVRENGVVHHHKEAE